MFKYQETIFLYHFQLPVIWKFINYELKTMQKQISFVYYDYQYLFF